MTGKSFTSEQLDAEWKRLAEDPANDAAFCAEAEFQRLAEEYETKLAELRDLARQSLTEKARHSNG